MSKPLPNLIELRAMAALNRKPCRVRLPNGTMMLVHSDWRPYRTPRDTTAGAAYVKRMDAAYREWHRAKTAAKFWSLPIPEMPRV